MHNFTSLVKWYTRIFSSFFLFVFLVCLYINKFLGMFSFYLLFIDLPTCTVEQGTIQFIIKSQFLQSMFLKSTYKEIYNRYMYIKSKSKGSNSYRTV